MNLKKICVLHLNQIGDMVFSLPLLKTLRDSFPHASIHSVVKPYLQELLSGSPFVDRIMLRQSGLKAKYGLLQKIRSNSYDLIISLARSEECLFLTSLSRAGIKAGFSNFPWDICLDIKENIEGHNSLYNNIKLLNRLNITVTASDYVGLINVSSTPDNPNLPEKFVIISPGASLRRLSKTWDHEKFAELTVLLNKNYGLTPVLVGSKENIQHNSKIIRTAEETCDSINIINLTGRLSLKSLCSVIKDAALFVGIDSGVMHLASSVDIPVVGLFGPTDPFYVGPQNQTSIVVREDEMACVPCYLKPCKHSNCMKRLEVKKVLHACEQMLNQQTDR